MLPHFALLLSLFQNPAPDRVDFTREVKPILAKNCLRCHGPEPESREAELRLDLRESAVLLRDDEYRVIEPGSAEDSELWLRITDPIDRMPPEDAGPALAEEEIAILTRWIDEGAEYRPHWSFVPLQRPEVPALPAAAPVDWRNSPVDAFIWQAMQEHQLNPAPVADKATLIRRASFDLLGLPPTEQEIAAFVADTRPDAWPRLLDQLMDSPHFGERWAAVWLDLARYADSKGYGSDPLREIWRYRDWVIDAFNADLPYDRFTLEQMAGDLLPDATTETRLATAFHRNSMTNTEGGTDDEEFRVAAVKERAALTMQVWMGLTFGCAECHTHKFDPITHDDYYSMFAVFNQTADTDRNDDSPRIATPTKAQQAAQERLRGEIATLREQINAHRPSPTALQAWEKEQLRGLDAWRPITLARTESSHGVHYRQSTAGVWLADATRPDRDVLTLVSEPLNRPVAGLRLEALAADSLPGSGPGLSVGNGNFVINEIEIRELPTSATVPRGRYLRIELPGAKRILSLAEVMVFSDANGDRLPGKARQSSTDFDGDAQRALDGNPDGRYQESQSVTHTRSEKDPWWEMDLGANHAIQRLVVFPRTDGTLHQRSAGMNIVLLDDQRQPVWSTWQASSSPSPMTLRPAEGRILRVRQARADHQQQGFSAAAAVDGEITSGWAIGPQQGHDHLLTLELAEVVPSGRVLEVVLRQQHGAGHVLGSFRLSGTEGALPNLLPPSIASALRLAPDHRQPAQRQAVEDYFASIDPALRALREEVAGLENKIKELKIPTTPVLVALPAAQQRKSFVLAKGNFLLPDHEVHARAPEAFNSFGPQVNDRLALARWLTDPANPLTARVAVNRWWARLFGRGIVLTEEDFGVQGALPTHPQLLDWLAAEYIDQGWSLKKWLKVVMTSAAYQQSSRQDPAKTALDPDNQWLARGPRFRLPAESVRDAALRVSGLMSDRIGGPSVFPPQPEGLWQAAFNGERDWTTSTGEDRYRRGLYTFMRRSTPYPSMVVFDAPSRETCTVRRIRTNTPLQAFVTLNDPVFVECAQSLGRRMWSYATADNERIAHGLMLVLGRPANLEQIEILSELLLQQRAHYASRPEQALAIATDPLGPLPAELSAAEAAAWTVLGNVLLNLDAFLVKD